MADTAFLSRFAHWAMSLHYDAIPEPVIRRTKLLLLDTICCALAGSRSQLASGTRKTIEAMGGAQQATLIGTPLKTSVFNAVLANTVYIRSLEINDIMGNDPADGAKLGGHPSDNTSTALAIGEWRNCPGRELLTAIVLAYEAFGRAQRLLERGLPWDHTSIHAFASAVCAARLLQLDAAQFANALGLVASHCPIFVVVRRGEISDAKFMSSAFGAQLGVQAAVLAMNGVTGPIGAFENELFKKALFPNRDENEWLRPFGPRFMVEGVTIKAFPSLDTGQALVEAACRMSRILERRTDHIAKIEVKMVDIPMVVQQMNDPERRNPKLQASATHSFSFLAAVPLIDGVLTPQTFETGQRWLDTEVRALMEKVSLSVDKAWLARAPGGMPVTYRVTLTSGETHEVEVPYAPGHQHNMMNQGQVLQKMANNAGPASTPRSRAALLEAINNLDRPGFTTPELMKVVSDLS